MWYEVTLAFMKESNIVINNALEIIKSSGATLVDPVEIRTLSHLGNAKDLVLQYELKADMKVYLDRLGMLRRFTH